MIGVGAAVLIVVVGVLLLHLGPLARYQTEDTPWGNAVVTDDGRHITVEFIGTEKNDRSSACFVRYSIHTLEQSLTAVLHQPLAGRAVVDGFDGRINAVRAANGECLQPPRELDPGPVPPHVSTTSTETTRSTGRTEIRVLFAFDLDREAILLVGGDKSDDRSGWYDTNIPIADERFDEHQQRLTAKKATTKQAATKKAGRKKGKGRR
jgi:hypothetical protein